MLRSLGLIAAVVHHYGVGWGLACERCFGFGLQVKGGNAKFKTQSVNPPVPPLACACESHVTPDRAWLLAFLFEATVRKYVPSDVCIDTRHLERNLDSMKAPTSSQGGAHETVRSPSLLRATLGDHIGTPQSQQARME